MFIILQMDAFEFADIIKNGLKSHHQRIKSIVPGYKIIYIIEDIDAYYGEIRSYRNQKMVAGMNNGQGAVRISKKAQERNRLIETLPDKASIEEELLWLQMQSKGDTFVHYSKQNETASWIKTFVVEIGHIPEWKSRNEESFDIQFGDRIKSGKDLKQTWQRMLECLPSITESRAIAIIEKYPTFNRLYSAYLTLSESEGQNLLTNINVKCYS